MLKFIQLSFVLCSLLTVCWGTAETVKLMDAAGRELELPANICRVYCTSPMGAIFVYTLAPDVLVGWNHRPTPTELAFMTPAARKLPILGGWFGKNGTANLETLLASAPDIILSVGTLGDTDRAFADRIQSQTGIPVVMADNALDACPEVYTLLGRLLQRPERAQQLADYTREKYQQIVELSAAIPESERVRFYYAEGLLGLETDSEISRHTESFRVAGGRNVCKVLNESGFGRSRVSMEQILMWQPEAIFIGRDKQDDLAAPPRWILDRKWRSLPAFRQGRVYQVPVAPFDWMDRPPSVNRIIGIQWAFYCMYPDRADFDMISEIRRFYKLFYHYELSLLEAEKLLQNSIVDLNHE
jgi:iron complex transport system substrate-binding protein